MTKPWMMIEDDDGVMQVIPIRDLYQHLVDPRCPCNPTFEMATTVVGFTCTHNSWDRRELAEPALVREEI